MSVAKKNLINNPKKIYEDENLIVIDKPAGIVVNRSKSLKGKNTLQDFVESMYPSVFENTEKGEVSDFLQRTGMVHRLDKDTSGLIIFALNKKSFDHLQKQFFDREVHKTYLAISYGVILDVTEGDEIEVDAPIGRNPKSREKFAIFKEGKVSHTKFVVKEILDGNLGKFTYFECFPTTGRTHQIRVHLTALNVPIVGDKLYSGRTRIKKNARLFPRQMLHASEISFKHPVNKKLIHLISTLPADFSSVLNLLQNN